MCDCLEYYITLSSSSRCPLVRLVHNFWFVIAGGVAVTVYGVADVTETMTVVVDADNLVAILLLLWSEEGIDVLL